MLRHAILLAIGLLVTGCSDSIVNAMTPGPTVDQDNFDDTRIVLQPPVGSALFSDDAWTMMGFEWQERNPDMVFVKVGMSGIINITGLELKADGAKIVGIQRTNTITDFDTNSFSWSRFRIPIGEFVKIASAADVRMRITLLDQYTVSRFGSGYSPSPVVNTKFAPFLAKVAEFRGGLD
jgi:hypothetical protein